MTIDAKESNDPHAKFNFLIKHWAIKDSKGNLIQGKAEREFGGSLGRKPGRVEEILDKKYQYKDLAETFSFYYDIPNSVKNLILEFEVEITSPQGEKVTVKDSIPLKRATFKTSFFEGLLD